MRTTWCDCIKKCKCPPGPQGPPGEQGPPGLQGPPGEQGPPSDSKCECCITPMRDILQAIKDQQEIDTGLLITELYITNAKETTTDKIKDIFPDAPNNYLVRFTKSNGTGPVVVPVCQIGGVKLNKVFDISLTEPDPDEKTGECGCCERPMRLYLKSLIEPKTQIDIMTDSAENNFNITNVNVIAVGEGIVHVKEAKNTPGFSAYVSICKITQIKEPKPSTNS